MRKASESKNKELILDEYYYPEASLVPFGTNVRPAVSKYESYNLTHSLDYEDYSKNSSIRTWEVLKFSLKQVKPQNKKSWAALITAIGLSAAGPMCDIMTIKELKNLPEHFQRCRDTGKIIDEKGLIQFSKVAALFVAEPIMTALSKLLLSHYLPNTKVPLFATCITNYENSKKLQKHITPSQLAVMLADYSMLNVKLAKLVILETIPNCLKLFTSTFILIDLVVSFADFTIMASLLILFFANVYKLVVLKINERKRKIAHDRQRSRLLLISAITSKFNCLPTISAWNEYDNSNKTIVKYFKEYKKIDTQESRFSILSIVWNKSATFIIVVSLLSFSLYVNFQSDSIDFKTLAYFTKIALGYINSSSLVPTFSSALSDLSIKALPIMRIVEEKPLYLPPVENLLSCSIDIEDLDSNLELINANMYCKLTGTQILKNANLLIEAHTIVYIYKMSSFYRECIGNFLTQNLNTISPVQLSHSEKSSKSIQDFNDASMLLSMISNSKLTNNSLFCNYTDDIDYFLTAYEFMLLGVNDENVTKEDLDNIIKELNFESIFSSFTGENASRRLREVQHKVTPTVIACMLFIKSLLKKVSLIVYNNIFEQIPLSYHKLIESVLTTLSVHCTIVILSAELNRDLIKNAKIYEFQNHHFIPLIIQESDIVNDVPVFASSVETLAQPEKKVKFDKFEISEQNAENPISVQSVEQTVENSLSVQPVEQTVENPLSVPPVEQTVENPLSVQPVEQTIENPLSVQPVEQTIENPLSVQPVEQTIENPLSVQPVEQTIENPLSVQPTEQTIENPLSVQPVEQTIENPLSVQPVEQIQSNEMLADSSSIQLNVEREPAHDVEESIILTSSEDID